MPGELEKTYAQLTKLIEDLGICQERAESIADFRTVSDGLTKASAEQRKLHETIAKGARGMSPAAQVPIVLEMVLAWPIEHQVAYLRRLLTMVDDSVLSEARS
jgi:hypothetical protein